MRIDKLPKPGSQFHLTRGVSSFEEKLRKTTRMGSLKNVHPHVDTIVETLKPYERMIRRGGGLSVPEQAIIMRKIKAEGGSMSRATARKISDVVAHLSQEEPDARTGKRGGILGSVFNRGNSSDHKVPWYRRARSLEDEALRESRNSLVSISQDKSKNSSVSVGSSAGADINPLTGRPTSGGIGRSGPPVGTQGLASGQDKGGGPPVPLAN